METYRQKGHIYIIKNRINSLVYIGQALKYRKNGTQFAGYQKRWKEHTYSARTKPTYHVDRTMKELGVTNFYVELLEECDINELDDREVHYILQYSSQVPNGYNVVLGNPHRATNPEHTSKALKLYYENPEVKQQHSQVHVNKFHPIDTSKEVEHVRIKPISEAGEAKIVYMYIKYVDGSSHRRRYGGIHITFDDSYQRCLADAKQLVSEEKIKDYVIHDVDTYQCQYANNVDRIRVVYQRMLTLDLVALIMYSGKVSKRKVFGGKTIPFSEAYNTAISFTKKLNVQNVEIDPKVVATLSN